MAGEQKQLSPIEMILEKGAVFFDKSKSDGKKSAALVEIINLIKALEAKKTERHVADLLHLTKEQRERLELITQNVLPKHPEYTEVKTFFEQYIYLEIINNEEKLWREVLPNYIYSEHYEELLNIIDGIKNSELRDAYKKRLIGLDKSFDLDNLEGLTPGNMRQFVEMVNTKLAISDGYNIILQEEIINTLGMSKHFALPNIEFHKISTVIHADKPPLPGPSAEEIAAQERTHLEERAQEHEASRKRVAEAMKEIKSLAATENPLAQNSSSPLVDAEKAIEHPSSQVIPVQDTAVSASRTETAPPTQTTTAQNDIRTKNAQKEGKILLRVKQTAKMLDDKKLQDASVRIVAPRWVEDELAKLSEKLQGKTFVFYEGEKKLELSFTVDGPLTLAQLSMIARNEVENTSGGIKFNNYPDIDKEVVYSLKDLVRHCVTVGTDVATHESGYKADLVKKKKVEKVYVCDLAGLQFQKEYNTGRLVLVGENLLKGLLDDQIYHATVGEKRPTLDQSRNDTTGRFIKVVGAIPQSIYCGNNVDENPPKELYLDTYAYSRFVAQDLVLAGLSLNALAENNGDEINFKFLKYGAGFFSAAFDGDPDFDRDRQNGLAECLLQGAYDGLQELFAHDPSQIKRIELPFCINEPPFHEKNPAPSAKMLALKEKIELLCAMNHRECGFNRKDALAKTSKYITASTTCGDPHVMAGNEMNHCSVDAAISENIVSKGNKYSPVINSAMQYGFGVLSPQQEIDNLHARFNHYHDNLKIAKLEDKEIILDQLHILLRQYKEHSLMDLPTLRDLEKKIEEDIKEYQISINEEIDDVLKKHSSYEMQAMWFDLDDGSNTAWLKRNPEKMLALAETNKNFAKHLSRLATGDVRFAAKLYSLAFKDITDNNINLRNTIINDIKNLSHSNAEMWIALNERDLLHNKNLVKLLAENNYHFASLFINHQKFTTHLGSVEIANILAKHEPKKIYDLVENQRNKIELLELLAQHHPEAAQKVSGFLEADFKSINSAIMSKWGVSGVNNFNEIKELYALINKLEILKSEFNALKSQSHSQQCDELLGVVGRLEVKEFRALSRAEVEELIKLSSPELLQDIERITPLAENNYHFALLYLQNKHTDKWSADALVKILAKYENNYEQYFSLFRTVVNLANQNENLAKDLFSKHANLFSPEQLYAIAKAHGSKQPELLGLLAVHNPEMAKKVSQVKVQIYNSTNKHSAKEDYKQSFAELNVGVAELVNAERDGRNSNRQEDSVTVNTVSGFERLSRTTQQHVLDSVFARVAKEVASESQGSTALSCVSYVKKTDDGKVIACIATANLADSSAFLIKRNKRTGEVSCLRINTQLHKATDAEERRRVEDKGGSVGPDERLNGKIAIARAFGDNKVDLAGYMSSVPSQDYQEFEIVEDEEITIINACDGLTERNKDKKGIKPQSNETNGIDAQLVQELLTEIIKQNPNCTPDVLSQKLAEAARDVCGSTDNISVITRRVTLDMVGHPPVMMGVFDGHGGPKVSQRVAEALPRYLQETVELALACKSDLSAVLNKYKVNEQLYKSLLASIAELANHDQEFATELFARHAALFTPAELNNILNGNNDKINLMKLLGEHQPSKVQEIAQLRVPDLKTFNTEVMSKWAVNRVNNAADVKAFYTLINKINELRAEFEALNSPINVAACDELIQTSKNILEGEHFIALAKNDYEFAKNVFTDIKSNGVARLLNEQQIFDIINSHEDKETLLNAVANYNTALRSRIEARILDYAIKAPYEVKQLWVEKNQGLLAKNKELLINLAKRDYSYAILILSQPTLATTLDQAERDLIFNAYHRDPNGLDANRLHSLMNAVNTADLEMFAASINKHPVDNANDVRALFDLINNIAEFGKRFTRRDIQYDDCDKLLRTAVDKLIGEQFFILAKNDYNFALDLFTKAKQNGIALRLTPKQTFEIINSHLSIEELLDLVGKYDTSTRKLVESSIRKEAIEQLNKLDDRESKERWIKHYSKVILEDPSLILGAALTDKFIAQRLLGANECVTKLNDDQIVQVLVKHLSTGDKTDKHLFSAALKAMKGEEEAKQLIDKALNVVAVQSALVMSVETKEEKAKRLGQALERMTIELSVHFGRDWLEVKDLLIEGAMRFPSVADAIGIYHELSGENVPKNMSLTKLYELANELAPRSTAAEKRSQYNDYQGMPLTQSLFESQLEQDERLRQEREKLDTSLQKDQKELNARFQKEREKQIEPLQPYWEAMLKAMDNVNNDPATAYYKVMTFLNEMQKYPLGEDQVGFLKTLEEKYQLPKPTAVNFLILEEYAKQLNDDKNNDAVSFCDSILKVKNRRERAIPEPLKRQDFPEIIASHKKLMESGDFLKTKPKVGAHQLKRLVGKHDKASGLPIDLVVNYIIDHPETAGRFFKKPTLGSRNFREELSRNPDLLYKLIDAGNPDIWKAMESTKLLDSSHLNKALNATQIKALADKLAAAPSLAEQARQSAERKEKFDTARTGDVNSIIELAEVYFATNQPDDLKEFASEAVALYTEAHIKQFRFSIGNNLGGIWSKLEDDNYFTSAVSIERSTIFGQVAVEIIHELNGNAIKDNDKVRPLVNLLRESSSPLIAKALSENKAILDLLIQQGYTEDLKKYYEKVGTASKYTQEFNKIMNKGLSSLSEASSQMQSSSLKDEDSVKTDEESLETGAQSVPSTQIHDEPDPPMKLKKVTEPDNSAMQELQERMRSLKQQGDRSMHNRQDCLDAIKKVQHPFYRELLEAAIKKQAQGYEFPNKENMEKFVEAVNQELKTGIDFKTHVRLIGDHKVPFLNVDHKYIGNKFISKPPTPKEQKQHSPEVSRELEAARRRVNNHNRSSGPKPQ